MGGILPGVALGVCVMVIAVSYGIKHKAEITRIPFSVRRVGRTFIRGIGAFLMLVIILGGIYTSIWHQPHSLWHHRMRESGNRLRNTAAGREPVRRGRAYPRQGR